MEPTEGRIPTPAAVTACRDAAPTDEKWIQARRDISRDNELRWVPMRVVM
ncbi:hypothetical protein [Mycobacterium colombiense]|nr:hypothetical protein [Mycobacterium colombiense]